MKTLSTVLTTLGVLMLCACGGSDSGPASSSSLGTKDPTKVSFSEATGTLSPTNVENIAENSINQTGGQPAFQLLSKTQNSDTQKEHRRLSNLFPKLMGTANTVNVSFGGYSDALPASCVTVQANVTTIDFDCFDQDTYEYTYQDGPNGTITETTTCSYAGAIIIEDEKIAGVDQLRYDNSQSSCTTQITNQAEQNIGTYSYDYLLSGLESYSSVTGAICEKVTVNDDGDSYAFDSCYNQNGNVYIEYQGESFVVVDMQLDDSNFDIEKYNFSMIDALGFQDVTCKVDDESDFSYEYSDFYDCVIE